MAVYRGAGYEGWDGYFTVQGRLGLWCGAAAPCVFVCQCAWQSIEDFIQDGYGMWMCTRRLAEGSFSWPRDIKELKHSLSREQLQALVVGLPWQRIGAKSAIMHV